MFSWTNKENIMWISLIWRCATGTVHMQEDNLSLGMGFIVTFFKMSSRPRWFYEVYNQEEGSLMKKHIIKLSENITSKI